MNARARRQHFELCLKTLEIEPADHALVPLLDEEGASARLELLFDESELATSQAEGSRILLGRGVRVGEKDLRGRLLDDGAADRTFEDIARALSR